MDGKGDSKAEPPRAKRRKREEEETSSSLPLVDRSNLDRQGGRSPMSRVHGVTEKELLEMEMDWLEERVDAAPRCEQDEERLAVESPPLRFVIIEKRQ